VLGAAVAVLRTAPLLKISAMVVPCAAGVEI
jgi:hypothetical protein